MERLRGRLEAWLLRVWFGPASRSDRLLAALLAPIALPLSGLVALIARRRRRALQRQTVVATPTIAVIVVGNLVAGGSGKTPLVAALASGLGARGHRAALLSGAYRASGAAVASLVDEHSNPALVGDEAVLLATLTGLPVAAGRDRAACLALLQARHPDLDLVISDDGLQHVGLPRLIELLVIDERGFGNGLCLPAGPLREPADRVDSVDAVILTGTDSSPRPHPRTFRSRVEVTAFCPLDGQSSWTPAEFLARHGGDRLAAIAGIARPARFFDTLSALGLAPACHPLPDHARIDADWLAGLPAQWLLMTAKDAVKCRQLPTALRARCIRVDIAARPESALLEWLEASLRNR